LLRVEEKFATGERDAAKLVAAASSVFAEEPQVRLDYFEVVDPETLEPVEKITGRTLCAVAAYVGSTRLIDNVVLGSLGERA